MNSLSIEEEIRSLLQTGSSRFAADRAADIVFDFPSTFKLLFSITVNEPYPLNMRASRVMWLSVASNPDLILPYLDRLTQLIISHPAEGVRRGLLKTVIESNCLVKIPDSGLLIDHCLNIIPSPAQANAIRVYAMEVVFEACRSNPGLLDEFIQVLELIDENSPVSVKTRAQSILKKLIL